MTPAQRIAAIPARYPERDKKRDRAIATLAADGDRELNLAEVLKAIRGEGLPPFKTLKDLLFIGRIVFVGKHRGDQRYKLAQAEFYKG